MCFVFIWEQRTTSATYSTNWLVFITKMKSVYCAVRTGSLNKAAWASSLKGYYWHTVLPDCGIILLKHVRVVSWVFMCFRCVSFVDIIKEKYSHWNLQVFQILTIDGTCQRVSFLYSLPVWIKENHKWCTKIQMILSRIFTSSEWQKI